MKDKALILKTGEILEIESEYEIKMMQVNFTMPDGLEIEQPESIELEYKDTNVKKNKEGNYYVLSNGTTYISTELVVGVYKIRDYKINNIIK